MKPEDMASNELKKLREKMTKEAINEHQMAQNEGEDDSSFYLSERKFRHENGYVPVWQVQGKGVYLYPAPDTLGWWADDDVCVLYGVWK